MTKYELTSLTVAKLKALAKKKKVSLSSSDKKADIVEALLASKSGKAAPKKQTAIKKVVTAAKKAAKKATAATKEAIKKAVKPGKPAVIEKASVVARRAVGSGAPRKPAASPKEWKRSPVTEEPLMAQERVAESKYYTGSATTAEVPAHNELPQSYGENKIVIMMRDPFVAYAYWEATPERIERERAWFGWNSKLTVRIYDVTGVQFDGRNAIGYFDQEIFDRSGNWYFDLGRPSHSFCADLGLLAPEGRFLTLARSNYITMPLDTSSDVIDDEWMIVDEEFWKLYGFPEVSGLSSPHMRMQEKELARRRRLLEITSPGLFSREGQKRKPRQ